MIVTATGVYGDTEEMFFEKLLFHNIDIFIDVRQRRGMRGSKYKFVNSLYLQDKLRTLNIEYRYLKALAPTNEIRCIQHKEDDCAGVLKSKRECLSKDFIQLYQDKILKEFNFKELLEDVGNKKIVFFCVEQKARACHRSLILDYLRNLGAEGYDF